MATRKRKPWNAEPGRLRFPSLDGSEPHKIEPTPDTLTVGHSTGTHFECLRCERVKLGKDVTGIDHIPTCEFRGTGKDPAVG